MTGVWTPERLDLQRALDGLDPVLAGLYGQIVTLLDQQPASTERTILIAHGVRELVNNLPEALSDVDGVPTRVDTSGPCQALAKEWQRHRDVVGFATDGPDSVSPTESDVDHPEVVTVPTTILFAAARVVTATLAGTDTAKLRSSAVVLGRLEHGNDPTVRLWRDAVGFFMKHVHLDKSRRRPVPSDGEMLANLEVLERVLITRLGRFFQTVEELADLTAAANRRRTNPPSSEGAS
jgi:hypothetical protein